MAAPGAIVLAKSRPAPEFADRTMQIRQLLEGVLPRLPARDALGRPIALDRSVFYVGFSCPSCSGDSELPLTKSANLLEVVYFFPDMVGRSLREHKVPANVRIVEDKRLSILPRGSYQLFPFSFRLDSSGAISTIRTEAVSTTAELEMMWRS